jgi:hypothetical protein
MAPGRGPGHLCWWPLIFKKNFLISLFIGSVGFDDHLSDSSLATILFASASYGGGCSADAYQQIVKDKQKFFFISIHKPPASIRFAPIKHALTITVEPFKFSPASRWLMN